jgi:ATP-dependent DNA helicase PIF1
MGVRTFELLDKRLCKIFNSKKPFGDVSIIVIGDLYQLSPIMENYVFEINSHNALNHISRPYLWRLFSFFELTEVMRQNEIEYINALYNLARGALTKDDFNIFTSRVVTTSKIIMLFTFLKQV